MQWNRWKKWLAAVMTLLLGVTVTACGTSGGSSGTQKTPVRIGFQVIPNTEAIAKAEHWHEQTIKNADVKWFSFDSGRDVNTALASGSIDIGVLGSTLVATGLSKGLGYQVIWLGDVIGANEALVAKNGRGIKSIGDLKGKTVAVTVGSTTQYSLLGALKTHGINPKDVHIVDMQPQDMVAAWKRGDIDAGYVWQPTLQQLVNDGGTVLIHSGDLVSKGIVTADTIVVRTAFAKEHPDIVAQYLESEIKAADFYKSHPNQAAAVVAKEFNLTSSEAGSMMKELIWLSGKEQASPEYLGGPGAPGAFIGVLEDTAKFLKDQGLIDSVPAPSVFQNAVAPQYLNQAMTIEASR